MELAVLVYVNYITSFTYSWKRMGYHQTSIIAAVGAEFPSTTPIDHRFWMRKTIMGDYSYFNLEVKNFIVLLDTRDGNGIEVSLSCKEDEMALIETNEELLACIRFDSLDPNVI